MTLIDKVAVLADSAKYDVSCSSSGSSRANQGRGVGNAAACGICHSWSADGRCISLLKILMSNACAYDCRYCVNRRSNDRQRATLAVKELVDLTIAMYRRNYIEGLFLSSGVVGDAQKTMELMLRVVKSLRRDRGFDGYIHIKAIPGADDRILREAGLWVDRMSVNIELPSSESLGLLAPEKTRHDVLAPMAMLNDKSREMTEYRPRSTKVSAFLPAGQTTQMIVGATPETDRHIVSLMESLYRSFHLKRVYFSAYVPVNSDLPALPSAMPALKREHRLYQADWLLRRYRFSAEEILEDDAPWLDESLDPKAAWALRHPEFFPLEACTADYEELLRVPGIGTLSARRIVESRRSSTPDFHALAKMGVVMKRARFFLLCRGRYDQGTVFVPSLLKRALASGAGPEPRQGELFS